MFIQTAARTVRLRAVLALALVMASVAAVAGGEAHAAAVLPQVAVTPAGAATFVWQSRDHYEEPHVVRTRTRSATGTLSASVILSQAGTEGTVPQVAVEDDGDAHFVWLSDDDHSATGYTNYTVQTRKRTAAGVLGPIRNLSVAARFIHPPKVAVDPAGNAVFVWARYDGTRNRIESASVSAAGAKSGVRTLSTASADEDPQVAVDSNGRATFVWERAIDSSRTVIETRSLPLGGALTANKWLTQATATLWADRPRVAVDADGDAVFTWTRMDGNQTNRVQTRTQTAAGALSATQTLSGAGGDAWVPELDVSPAGRAVFTWLYTNPAANYMDMVQTRARAANGTLSAVTNLTGAAGPKPYKPQVGVDQDGDASFIYAQEPSASGGYDLARSRSLSAGGVLTGVLTLSQTFGDAKATDVAVDQDGDAIFVWERDFTIEARRRSSAGAVTRVQAIG